MDTAADRSMDRLVPARYESTRLVYPYSLFGKCIKHLPAQVHRVITFNDRTAVLWITGRRPYTPRMLDTLVRARIVGALTPCGPFLSAMQPSRACKTNKRSFIHVVGVNGSALLSDPSLQKAEGRRQKRAVSSHASSGQRITDCRFWGCRPTSSMRGTVG
ncbi:hypothetical protein BDW74DRAFT_27892 [Aspergillus multicolor]|uniref:uncharacterized protein n=1 Tax=Aspergillus multicolor TaxID=41759 RepID=UPI003CCDD326